MEDPLDDMKSAVKLRAEAIAVLMEWAREWEEMTWRERMAWRIKRLWGYLNGR